MTQIGPDNDLAARKAAAKASGLPPEMASLFTINDGVAEFRPPVSFADMTASKEQDEPSVNLLGGKWLK